MQDKIGLKREKFVKEIRRKQIETYMTECRSKLVANWQERVSRDNCSFLNTMCPPHLSTFSKLKLFFVSIAKNEMVQITQEPIISNTCPINALLTSTEGYKFCIRKATANLSQLWINQSQLSSCILELSRQISTKISEINTSIQKINKINTGQQADLQLIYQLMTEVYGISKDFKQINLCCNSFLESYINLLSNFQNVHINKALLEAVTSCLIEISCFKPRKYTNSYNLPIVNNFNLIMKELRQILNTSTARNLMIIVKEVAFRSFDAKLMTNIIYIFGNIFVSFSSNESEGKGLYEQLHKLIFDVFRHIFKIIESQNQANMSAVQTELIKQFPELASLMVWFIRNQILIVEGMFRVHQSQQSISQESPKYADSNWTEISFLILVRLEKQMKKGNNQLSEENASTIGAIISLLILLRNDCNLHPKNMWLAFTFLYPFKDILQIDKPYHQELQQKIYQFCIELISTQFVEDKQFNESKESIQSNLQSYIYSEVLQITRRENVTASGLKLVAKVVSLVKKMNDEQKKKKFCQNICCNFDIFLNNVNRTSKYEQSKEFLLLVPSIIEVSEILNGSEMKNEWLSYETVKCILKLCESIWQADKSSEDIINTLQLLKIVSDNNNFANHLKEVIMNEGYYQQLQSLSSHVHQDINRLVYQIYQILQLE